jgi:hypothetical protein
MFYLPLQQSYDKTTNIIDAWKNTSNIEEWITHHYPCKAERQAFDSMRTALRKVRGAFESFSL